MTTTIIIIIIHWMLYVWVFVEAVYCFFTVFILSPWSVGPSYPLILWGRYGPLSKTPENDQLGLKLLNFRKPVLWFWTISWGAYGSPLGIGLLFQPWSMPEMFYNSFTCLACRLLLRKRYRQRSFHLGKILPLRRHAQKRFWVKFIIFSRYLNLSSS